MKKLISKNVEIPEEVILAIAGVIDALEEPDEEEATSTAEHPVGDVHMDRAQELRDVYEAFLKVGFTEEQATSFVCAILN